MGNFDIKVDREKKDLIDLKEIWSLYKKSDMTLITCEDESLEEFIKGLEKADKNYKVNNISEIPFLLENMGEKDRRALESYEFYQQCKKGHLLIQPWGEYGYGRGPYGGGDFEFLDKIRKLLNREYIDSDRDRDVRHIFHYLKYQKDQDIEFKPKFFLTMDYKLKETLEKNVNDKDSKVYQKIVTFLRKEGYVIDLRTPSEFIVDFKNNALN